MGNTPKKFSMQQVFSILVRDPATKKIIGFSDTLKTSGLENTIELVYPTGSAGNVYVGGAWAHSRRATINVTDALFRTEIMAAQNGTEIVESAAGTPVNVVEHEILEAKENKVTLTYTALGTAGSEIGYAYLLDESGNRIKTLTQITGSATTGKFTYATKAISFFAGDVADGSKVEVVYTRATAEGAQRMEVLSNGIPKLGLVTLFGVAADACTGELFKAQIDGLGQIDGNWNLDVSADGDVATQDFKIEFIKRCDSNKLYDFTVYTDEEGAGA